MVTDCSQRWATSNANPPAESYAGTLSVSCWLSMDSRLAPQDRNPDRNATPPVQFAERLVARTS
jgi:hypothetical protein